MSNDSGRHNVLALWLFLTIAAVGLALIGASFLVPSLPLLPIGTAVLASGAFCFLVVQFWVTGTRPAAVVGRPMPNRPIDFTYTNPVPAAMPRSTHQLPEGIAAGGRHHAPPPEFTDDLVEFQLAESEAPTSLKVPTAFQVEVQADAEPVANQPWIEQTITASGGPAEREFVPAVERRQEIVSGLPLLSQIFSETRPQTPEPAGERPSKTRGQCGSCGTFLWAPTQRPIRLRCPKCGHVKTLTD